MAESDDDQRTKNESSGGMKMTEKEIIKTLLSTSVVKMKDLVPSGPLKSENAMKVAKWILTSKSKKRSPNMILQRIKWLTAVVQYGIVDSLVELEKLFTPFIQLIYTAKYQASVCHLLYMIATPNMYRFQVERITKSVNVVGLTNSLAGLLSRVKSLRPDLVPQTIPHQSDAISFPKAPSTIRNGFYALSEGIKERNEIPNQVTFSIETGKERTTKKMRLDIIPRVQHINLKSSFQVDFRKMVPLSRLQSFDDLLSKITSVELPNHVGSLLSKKEYHYVLSLHFTPRMEALLSQWLYLVLHHEFMERPQVHGREGKTLLLQRILEFQQNTGRKLMVVYDFLSLYLLTWDGIQFSDQIFQLLAHIPFLPYPDLNGNFLQVLEGLFHSCDTSHRLKIIDVCRKLIHNLLLQQFGPVGRAKLLFQKSEKTFSPEEILQLVEGTYVISEVIRFTERLLNTALTSSSDSSLVLNSLLFHLWLIDLESEFQLPFRTFCQPITVYMALFSPAPVTVSLLCQLMCKYGELGRNQLIAMSILPELGEFRQDSLEDAAILNRYIIDISRCLIYHKAFALGGNSMLALLPRKNLKKLSNLGSFQSSFALERHPAFTGISRRWQKSKSGNGKSLKLFEEVDADLDDYTRYMLGRFTAIMDYIQQFHKST
ncbi:hypothetical protein DAPPUDRAFT_300700 [Daphnia pulex]|uniref:Centromere protein I n=1 Tax=Daphnia pulex TaxID=6669 RepID=E9HEV0_DAPPU|nr:hypothetical protein DAPPUDRAFT_300700 [Daphnia pulex]|eukprot:EFX69734.1 hypothetical protein DAPPUDRAFT_300700 [Daphnia pulex]